MNESPDQPLFVDDRVEARVEAVEAQLGATYAAVDRVLERNLVRILEAFRRRRLSPAHFVGSTGYGYGDAGRETLEAIFADVFGGEAAIVRPHILSGTHAIASVLFALSRPGDNIVFATGVPYDTLHPVIGPSGRGQGNLPDYGVDVRIVPLAGDGSIDIPAVLRAMDDRTALVAFQRSRGYQDRRSLFVAEIGEAVRAVKTKKADVCTFVDNCYGEFVETIEPPHVGVDVIAGSLIKNPGGGIAKSGGYIVGSRDAVAKIAYRLGAPGIGLEGGAVPGGWLDYYLGFFLAPHIVAEALKGAHLTAALFASFGFRVDPPPHGPRTDLIQAVEFGRPDVLLTFMRAVQAASPVDAFAVPTPGEMPGYQDPIVMAAGTFIQGSSIEFSADAPLRPPYRGYVQGGLMRAHVKYALVRAFSELVRQGLLSITDTSG